MQVAGHVVGLADIGQDELPHVLVALACFHELADGDPQALFKAVPGPRADAVAPHVGVVDGGAEVGDGHGVAPGSRGAPHRHQHGHVQQLARGEIGVVGNQHVARLESLGGEFVKHVGRPDGQGVDVSRRAGNRLGHHAAPLVEHRVGQVAGLAHNGAERGPLERPGLLVHHRDERLPQDFQLNRVVCGGFLWACCGLTHRTALVSR